MEQAICVRNLRKEYGAKVAVKDISFEVERGTLFSLLGVNGAGKTTTIKMLTGLAKPTAGDALVMGDNICKEIDKVKKHVNISTQDTAIAPKLTVKENLEFIAGVYGMSKSETDKRVQEMIDKFGLHEVKNAKAKTLSGGWQRKLSIAMALITEPEVVFMDEPTLGLDVLARRELWTVIEEIKKNVTIVLTTHYMEEAEALSDKIAIMVDGEIKMIGTLDEIKSATGKEKLEEAFISCVNLGSRA